MNKQYYWQKTDKCTSCVWNDNPDACHYYGYLFWPDLPQADDCWQFLTADQWKEIQSLRFERDRLERWNQIRITRIYPRTTSRPMLYISIATPIKSLWS